MYHIHTPVVCLFFLPVEIRENGLLIRFGLLLELQSCLGHKPDNSQVLCHQGGTAALTHNNTSTWYEKSQSFCEYRIHTRSCCAGHVTNTWATDPSTRCASLLGRRRLAFFCSRSTAVVVRAPLRVRDCGQIPIICIWLLKSRNKA